MTSKDKVNNCAQLKSYADHCYHATKLKIQPVRTPATNTRRGTEGLTIWYIKYVA